MRNEEEPNKNILFLAEELNNTEKMQQVKLFLFLINTSIFTLISISSYSQNESTINSNEINGKYSAIINKKLVHITIYRFEHIISSSTHTMRYKGKSAKPYRVLCRIEKFNNKKGKGEPEVSEYKGASYLFGNNFTLKLSRLNANQGIKEIKIVFLKNNDITINNTSYAGNYKKIAGINNTMDKLVTFYQNDFWNYYKETANNYGKFLKTRKDGLIMNQNDDVVLYFDKGFNPNSIKNHSIRIEMLALNETLGLNILSGRTVAVIKHNATSYKYSFFDRFYPKIDVIEVYLFDKENKFNSSNKLFEINIKKTEFDNFIYSYRVPEDSYAKVVKVKPKKEFTLTTYTQENIMYGPSKNKAYGGKKEGEIVFADDILRGRKFLLTTNDKKKCVLDFTNNSRLIENSGRYANFINIEYNYSNYSYYDDGIQKVREFGVIKNEDELYLVELSSKQVISTRDYIDTEYRAYGKLTDITNKNVIVPEYEILIHSNIALFPFINPSEKTFDVNLKYHEYLYDIYYGRFKIAKEKEVNFEAFHNYFLIEFYSRYKNYLSNRAVDYNWTYTERTRNSGVIIKEVETPQHIKLEPKFKSNFSKYLNSINPPTTWIERIMKRYSPNDIEFQQFYENFYRYSTGLPPVNSLRDITKL